MAMIRPSLTLVLDLDERLATNDTVLEIKRCYAHIGTPVVRTHAAQGEDAPLRNTAQMLVSMGTYRYFESDADGADERWADIVEPWVGNMLFKIGHNMPAFNRRQRQIGLPELVFDRIDVVLGDGAFTVSLHPDPTSFVDRPLGAQVGLARSLFNQGLLHDAVSIEVPSEEAYEAQRELAWAIWSDEQEAKRAADQAAQAQASDGETAAASAESAIAGAADAGEAGDAGTDQGGYHAIPMPDYSDTEAYEAWLKADAEAKSYENTAVAPTDSDALPPVEHEEEPPEPELFTFDVDYTLWKVAFADGSTALFDATARAFVDNVA